MSEEQDLLKRAMIVGSQAREVFWSEMGEDADASDFIGDTLSDSGFSNDVIEKVLKKLCIERLVLQLCQRRRIR